MKEVTAVVRRDRGRETLEALERTGFEAVAIDALGKGRERGLRYPGGSAGIRFLPKALITLTVGNEEVDRAVEVVSEVNRTGEIGDGKVFVSPTEPTRWE